MIYLCLCQKINQRIVDEQMFKDSQTKLGIYITLLLFERLIYNNPIKNVTKLNIQRCSGVLMFRRKQLS
ncbi:unnamed protein product [Paramecium octaurelia]|uniref:Uncharacterized protein n=1 Tax=Paramecium octaurelia TaxID=43137 RepID=A0A8S1X0E9_PAROT|nr:unnamed protein product [Paramecium octaurelia]